MNSFEDQNITYTFHCDCGSDGFKRAKRSMAAMPFHQGNFICSNCKKAHDYSSNAVMKNYTRRGLF